MKKILIIADKLNSGGVEVSLLNLIEKLSNDEKNIDITVMLMQRKGVYLEDFRSKCNLKEVKFKKEIYKKSYINEYKEIRKNESFINKLIALYLKILKKINISKFYKFILKKSIELKEDYDILIDFHSYGYFGTCYGAEKIKAKNKILFIHDEKIDFLENTLDWIKYYNKIFCVSKSCLNTVEKKYPNFKSKLDVFHNIISEEKIKEQSNQDMNYIFDKDIKNLLTIGRLEYQKGYDILIKIAIELKKLGYKFKWYIIGIGSQKLYLQNLINENDLSDTVILLGMKKNPYPYLKNCDIYVQPSRHEGYGIAIAEARCLNKVIVASKINCIEEQIENGVNGVLCNIDVNSFVKEIKFLLDNYSEIKRLESNLKKENIKIKNDIYKIYELL